MYKAGATGGISIHAPIVGCDTSLYEAFSTVLERFQSTHPSWGATHRCMRLLARFWNDFNPRTHRGVRPPKVNYTLKANVISIHAPIVGCDGGIAFSSTGINDFNPRTHRGVRHTPQGAQAFRIKFQSTHPSWGATLRSSQYCLMV